MSRPTFTGTSEIVPIGQRPNTRYVIHAKRLNRPVAVTHTPRKAAQGMPGFLLEVGDVSAVELDDTEARTVAELLTAGRLTALLGAIGAMPMPTTDAEREVEPFWMTSIRQAWEAFR